MNMYSTNVFCILFMLTISLCTASTVNETCGINEFQCTNSSNCIDIAGRCDNSFNCPDLSDEENCTSAEICPEGQKKCPDGECYLDNQNCATLLPASPEVSFAISTPLISSSPSLTTTPPSTQYISIYMTTSEGNSDMQQTTNFNLSPSISETSDYYITSSLPSNSHSSLFVDLFSSSQVNSSSIIPTYTGVLSTSLTVTDVNTFIISSSSVPLTLSTSFHQLEPSSSFNTDGASSSASSLSDMITTHDLTFITSTTASFPTILSNISTDISSTEILSMVSSDITTGITTSITTPAVTIINVQSNITDLIVSLAIAGVLILLIIVASVFVVKYAKDRRNQRNREDSRDVLWSDEKYELNSVDISFKNNWHFPDYDDRF